MVQFRKSKKFGIGRLTLTERGLSSSIGAGPLRVSFGADRKIRRTIRVPGVPLSIYDTKVVGSVGGEKRSSQARPDDSADVSGALLSSADAGPPASEVPAMPPLQPPPEGPVRGFFFWRGFFSGVARGFKSGLK